VVEANPQASLRDITEMVANLDITKSTVDKIIHGLDFKLVVPRKKPFLRKEQKQKRLEWCRRRRSWGLEEWRKIVWLDEATVQYVPYQAGRKVRIHPGEELKDENLQPSFKSGRISVGCWAAYCYGSRTKLIWVRKRTPNERVSTRDRLGLKGAQYATEIHECCLIPYLLSLDHPIDRIRVVEDGAPYHKGEKNRRIQEAYGEKKLLLPPNSPDLNPIENAWNSLKARLRNRFSKPERRPHSEDELWQAMVEEWEGIEQDRMDSWVDSMSERVANVIAMDGGHTKW
jgi:transposase